MVNVRRPEVDFLLLCIRQHLTSGHQSQLLALARQYSLDWHYLFEIGVSHGIAPLFFTNMEQVGLDQLAVPPAIRAALQENCYRNIAAKAGVQAKLVEICAFCAQRDVDIMLLKGTALDQLVYQEPWYVVHDVDLLLRSVHGRDRSAERIDTMQAIERFFWTLPGFEYEFDTHHDLTMNGLLAINIAEIWTDAQQLELAAQVTWVMSAEDLLIAACINACRKRFFNLKTLLAIASLVDHYKSLDWTRLAAKAKRDHVAKIVYSALWVTRMSLGVAFPENLAQHLGITPLHNRSIRWIINYLLQQENPFPIMMSGQNQRGPSRSLLLTYGSYTPQQLWRKGTSLIQSIPQRNHACFL